MGRSIKIGRLNIEDAATRFTSQYDELVDIIANDSLNHFLEGFRQGAGKGGGQTNDSKDGWKPRKDQDNPNNAGRAILIGSSGGFAGESGAGKLFRDIDIRSKGNNKIEIGTSRIPYAEIHNEGGTVPERRPVRRKTLAWQSGSGMVFAKSAKAFEMPKREFIGDSDELEAKTEKEINDFMDDILRKGK